MDEPVKTIATYLFLFLVLIPIGSLVAAIPVTAFAVLTLKIKDLLYGRRFERSRRKQNRRANDD